jgi:Fe-S cluster assembly ATPase SufC
VLEIEGVTVAVVNDKLQLQKVETWFDPLDMFRQMGPIGEDKSGTSANVSGQCPMGFKTKL